MNIDIIKNFIVDNWQFISIALIIICNVFLFLIRRKEKKTSFDVALENFLINLPLFVIQAEKIYGAGAGHSKLDYVLSQCFSKLENELGRTLTCSEKKQIDREINYQINAILSAPVKKGGFGRE